MVSKHWFIPIFHWRGNRVRCRLRFIKPTFKHRWWIRHVRDDYPGVGRVYRWWIRCVLFTILFTAMVDAGGKAGNARW